MVDAVTFDLWNTLLCDRHYGDYRINLLTRILRNEGFSRDRQVARAAYSSMIDYFNEAWRRERRHVPAEDLTEFVLGRLEVHLPNDLKSALVKGFEEAIFHDPPPLMKYAEEVLKSVHRRHRIGLISNSGVTPGRILRRVLRDHRVLQYFSCTVFSDEVGYHKPHPAIFRRAVEELQVEVSEVMHVGDLVEVDVAGAKAIGMKAVWFNNTERQYQIDEMEFTPDYEIVTLSQVMEILEK